ncbi:MAG: EAL domain-containing protein [Rhizobiaceae bacterium]
MSISTASLRLQIIIPLFFVIIAGVGVTMLAASLAANGQRELAKIMEQALDARAESHTLSIKIDKLEKEVSRFLDMTTFIPTETINSRFHTQDITISKTLNRLSENMLSKEISEEIEKLDSTYKIWRESIKVSLGLLPAKFIPTREMLSRQHGAVASITKRVNSLVTHTAQSRTDEATQTLDNIIKLELAILAVGGIIGMFACWYVARQIANPILGITSIMNVLADGVTNIQLPERKFASEINSMMDALEVFRRNAIELAEAHKETETARSVAHSISRQDPLTNGPNRRVFTEHIEKLTESGAGSVPGTEPNRFAVLLIDLDRFKPINDIYGHAAGDFVICQIAERLQAAIDIHGVVARLGGDEFGVVFSNKHLSNIRTSAENLAAQIVKLIESPIHSEIVHAEISASIGIAVYPDHGANAQSLLRAADLAMYHVKQNGRSSYSVFNPDLDEKMRATAQLESDAREAVRNNEFVPYFQPVINIADNSIYGFEALARWQHPEQGFVPPDRFIPIMEQFDLMNGFTGNILRQACEAARHWPRDTKLAINISAGEVCDPSTPMRLMSILNECDFLPTRLEVEITETALVKNFDTAKSVIAALRQAGIRVLLDDFGTGYSSLSYLKELTVDCLKIDRSFIMSMGQNRDSKNIVFSMLSLAQSLGLDTVAEGVESALVHKEISLGNATFGQGYFYGRPVSAEETAELLDMHYNKLVEAS